MPFEPVHIARITRNHRAPEVEQFLGVCGLAMEWIKEGIRHIRGHNRPCIAWPFVPGVADRGNILERSVF